MPRQRWGRRIEFFLTSVGYSVGVGDLWRFPYLVMKNGGGAFLIPIVIFNIVGAMPIVYLEMIMGQYSQTGAVPVWNVCPLLKGVGYGTLISTFLFSIYYAVIIGWMLFYFVHSFFNPLPWATCDNWWNNEQCVISKSVPPADNITTTMNTSLTTILTTLFNFTETVTSVAPTSPAFNTSANTTMLMTTAARYSGRQETAAEQFWKYRTHDITGGLDDLGGINWPIFGCLVAIEIGCFLCIFKGVKLTGKMALPLVHPNSVYVSVVYIGMLMKVVYFTVLGPFILLFVFLIRGATLEGAEKGILFYITPDLSKLRDTKIWAEACMQVFVSIGPGFGGMITFASYNKFTNNCMRDAILVCLMDLLTGFFGGFVIFSVIGHVSHRTNIPIEWFNQSGYGLGFVAYPEAANYLPPPQLWCALFFFMSIFLGIDSQFPNYEIVVTGLRDEFPKWLKGKTSILTLIVIVFAFVLAIPQTFQGGIYLLTLVDWYAATFSVTIFALIECLVMTYIYGLANVDKNMREMTGFGIPIIFRVAWYFFTPLLLVVTIGFAIFTYAPPAYGGYEYPPWAVNLGWMIAASSLVPIPIVIAVRLYRTPGSLLERIRVNLRPNSLWGPPKDYEEGEEGKEKEKEIANGVSADEPGVWSTQDGVENKGFDNIAGPPPYDTRL